MSLVDATLRVARDGAIWDEPHWLEMSSLEDSPTRYRIVDIQDGTGLPRPFMVYVLPDRT